MRKALFVMLALVAGTAAARGNDEAPWAEKLFDSKTEHDFGSVPHGAQMFHKFAFKNIYKVPLDVTIAAQILRLLRELRDRFGELRWSYGSYGDTELR